MNPCVVICILKGLSYCLSTSVTTTRRMNWPKSLEREFSVLFPKNMVTGSFPVRGIHRSLVNSPHKGQWYGALMFSLICAWTNGRVNIRVADDLRRNRAHHDVTLMTSCAQASILYDEFENCSFKITVTSPRRGKWVNILWDLFCFISRARRSYEGSLWWT